MSSERVLFCFRWYKFIEGTTRKQPVTLDDRVKQVSGTLIIKEAKVEDSGKYLCVVNNSVGGQYIPSYFIITCTIVFSDDKKYTNYVGRELSKTSIHIKILIISIQPKKKLFYAYVIQFSYYYFYNKYCAPGNFWTPGALGSHNNNVIYLICNTAHQQIVLSKIHLLYFLFFLLREYVT